MKLTDLIYKKLKISEHLRDCDNDLYLAVCTELNPSAIHKPFYEVMLDLKSYGLPSIETVTRLRRKVQAEHPEVRASEKVTQWREVKEEQARAGIFV